MLYAKFMYPNYGREYDKERVKKMELKVGERYEVEYVDMGQSSTSIYLKNINGSFNSVHFEFEEDGVPTDIYSNPKYNPYIKMLKE